MAMSRNQFADWGAETLEMIRRDFYLPERKLYGDSIINGQKPKRVAFNWGCGVQLSALAAGARTNKKYKTWLREFADQMHTYWNPKPPVPGFDVLPGPKDPDRYYDDNAWMVMALCETSDVLKDKKYLTLADEALTYVLSGEDSKLGGGIYWRESAKSTKNTCSNAPSAAACIAVYRRTHNKDLLNKAVDLYAWTRKYLQDPKDSLFWDSINLKHKIDHTKWSYNTALMIRTAAQLYQETNLPEYKDQAIAMVHASETRWLKDGKLHDGGRFAHLLLESWLIAAQAIPELAPEAAKMQAPLEFLHSDVKNAQGHYSGSWSKPHPLNQSPQELIDQASAARAYFEFGESKRVASN